MPPPPAGPEPHHPAGAVEQDRTRGRRQSEIGPERAGVAGAVTCRDVPLGHRHLGTGPAGRGVDRLARHEVTAPAEAAHHVERGVARLQQADAAPLVGRHHPGEAVFVVASDPDPAQPIHHAAAHQQRVGGDRHGRAADHPGEQIPLARRRLRHHGPDRARDQLRRLLRGCPAVAATASGGSSSRLPPQPTSASRASPQAYFSASIAGREPRPALSTPLGRIGHRAVGSTILPGRTGSARSGAGGLG